MIKVTVKSVYKIQIKYQLFKQKEFCQEKMLYEKSLTHDEEDYLAKFMRKRMDDQLEDSKCGSDSKYEESPQIDRNQNRKKSVRFEGFYEQGNEQQDLDIQQPGYESKIQRKQRDNSNFQLQEQQQTQVNACDDSFLNLVDNHLQNLKKQSQQNQQKQLIKQSNIQLEIISLSKQEVCHCLLENQTTIDVVQLTNLLPTKSIAQIINAPFQFKLLNAKNKFLQKDQVEIILQPYQSVQIQFEIKKRLNQIGNIYQTLRIDTYQINSPKKSLSKFIKFQITFVKPKLQVNFIGRTSVKRINEHKIAHLEIYPNQMGQYCLYLLFSQDQFSTLNSSTLQKIQCQIQTKGYISIHPSSVILYQDQPLKIMLRRLTQSSGIGKTSVILIRLLNSSLTYVLGVKCMERVQKSTQQQQFSNKLNKLML